jgi:predicted nucleic acid-binding protein
MRVVDSSVWIEWLSKTALAQQLSQQIPPRDECIVPTIVQLELTKWLYREKGEEAVNSFTAYTMQCNVVPLDTMLAREAAEICRKQRLATADAIIYATALHYGADIVTCDAHFKDFENVIYVAKAAD